MLAEGIFDKSWKRFTKDALNPDVCVQEECHLDASHSIPVLKISPLILPFPLRAPCQVRGLAARKMNSWPSEMMVTVSPLAAFAFMRAKSRWNSRELTVMSVKVSDTRNNVNVRAATIA